MIFEKTVAAVHDALKGKSGGITLGLIIFGLTSGYNWLKKWFQQGSPREKQLASTLEANRLLKLHETLAKASEPSAKVTKAQAAVEDRLNHELENLAHQLTDPEAAATHSPFWTAAGKYLLLYHSTGILSGVMHWIFYLLAFLWALFVPFVFTAVPDEKAIDLLASLVTLLPVVGWNYLARKVDGRLSNRHLEANQAAARARIISK